MSTWMLYAVAVGALVGLAALALERAALAFGRSTRWVWLGAMASSAVLPVVLPRLAADRAAAGGASIGTIEVIGFGAPAATVAAGASPPLDGVLLGGWLALSLGLLALFVVTVGVLNRRRRVWRHRVVGGASVLVSEQTGPALVGFLAPELVLPAWILDMDERSLDLLIAHEWEHRREGDPLLLLAAIGAVILVPWNLPLWWQARRLRLAIEVDCDARVLRRHHDPRRYGLLLLEVGRRAAGTALPVAAFIHPTSFLERRMRVLVNGGGLSRSAALVAILVALVPPAVVFAIPKPDVPELVITRPSDRETPTATAEAVAPAELADSDEVAGVRAVKPVVAAEDLPMNATAPSQKEPVAIVAEEEPVMPGQTRSRGIAVWTKPGTSAHAARGEVAPLNTVSESGRDQTDRAVEPAGRTDAREDTVPVSAGPRFTPYDRRPELANRQEFIQTLAAAYPPALKEEGIGGTTLLWIFIDETGKVGETRVTQSSGHPPLDDAAEEAMLTARFTPARLRDEAVQVWIQLPVTFHPEP